MKSLPRAVWIWLVFLLVASACVGDTPPADPAPVASTTEVIRSESFIVYGDDWSPENLDRRVPIQATVMNDFDEIHTPACYLVDRSVGLIELDDPSPMAPGEERKVTGTASFPIPGFNYECEGMCKGVKCVVPGEEPRYIKSYLSFYEGIPTPETRVTVPNLDGRYLYRIGYPLYKRGLRVRISQALIDAWRRYRRAGGFGLGSPETELRSVLMNTRLNPGPKVRLAPGPGSKVKVGTVIVLKPF